MSYFLSSTRLIVSSVTLSIVLLSGCSKDNIETLDKYGFYKQRTPDNLELAREQLRKAMNKQENNELLSK